MGMTHAATSTSTTLKCCRSGTGMCKPTIYIAGSSRDLERAKRAMALAEECGFKIQYDWVAAIEANGGRANEDVDEATAIRASRSCLMAAVEADVMWCLLDPVHRSPGMHAELGARVSTE